MANHVATWDIRLDCKCPHCGIDINLMDNPNICIGEELQVCENDTERTKDFEVKCWACNREFIVDFAY